MFPIEIQSRARACDAFVSTARAPWSVLRTIPVVAALALGLGLSATPAGQANARSPKAEKKKRKVAAPAPYTTYDFEMDSVAGEVLSPSGASINTA